MTEEIRTDNSETFKNALNRIAELEKQIEKMKSQDWHELPAPQEGPKKTIASAICDNACQVCPFGKNCDQEVEE